MGSWFWRCDARPEGVFNPCDETEVERYFAGPFQAKPYADVYEKIGDQQNWPSPAGSDLYCFDRDLGRPAWTKTSSPFVGIPDDWPVIVVRPGERILGHSHEFVGIRAPGTSMLKARSGTGRIGVKVCSDAGWGDPDFLGRWAWEMENANDEAIILPVGDRYAQIVLFDTGPVGRGYVDGGGSYQDSVDVDRLVEEWVPQMMLPQWWRSTRTKPLSLDRDLYDGTIKAIVDERVARERARMIEAHRVGSESVL